MRIAYFGHVNGGTDSGVFNKMASQVDRWRAEGHEVRTFIATREAGEPWQARFGDAVVGRYDGALSRLRAMTHLVRAVRRFRPDIVYLRWDLFYPPMLAFPRGAKLVVEINTDDLAEYALGRRLRAVYNARTRGLVMGRAQALVFVTGELSRQASFSRFPGRHCVLTNGIDLASYPVFPAPRNERPRLIFVGTAGQPWHGIDKVVMLARSRPEWRFEVVGMRREGAASPANITWHGPLERAAVLEVLALADVGIGTLALHRKSMAEACPLKVREYLAVGLPVLYGYMDPDADRLEPLTLRIANTESNVVDEIDRIDAFVGAARGKRIPRSHLAHLETHAKERQRLALFDALARH